MKRLLIILPVLLFVLSHSAKGQSGSPVFLELGTDNRFIFYFDDQYFLVDKNCEFFSIKRLSNYNTKTKTFEGPFTDYARDGSIVLTGAYKEGKMDGVFKAFYPAGFLKWQTEFNEGKPAGTWFFYYPDGSPMSIIKIKEENIYVTDTWDNEGRPMVKNGFGKFELTDPLFGFNEQGYAAVKYTGSIANGAPAGIWKIFFGFAKGRDELAAIKNFGPGDATTSSPASSSPAPVDIKFRNMPVQFVPSSPHLNAELLISKNCTVDDYYNYTGYLSQYLTLHLHGLPPEEAIGKTVQFSLTVNKAGRSSAISMIESFGNKQTDMALLSCLKSIPYWIPSQKNGQTIKDKLTVSFDIEADSDGNGMFTNLKITRSQGS